MLYGNLTPRLRHGDVVLDASLLWVVCMCTQVCWRRWRLGPSPALAPSSADTLRMRRYGAGVYLRVARLRL